MLFNSEVFILGFLPVALIVFFVIGSRHHLLAAAWLTAASLLFYGWWNPQYVGLLVLSIAFNYILGTQLLSGHGKRAKRTFLFIGIAANLAVLSYYKYVVFLAENLGWSGIDVSIASSILPLGISFFTFTQIAFLVDAYRGETLRHNPVHFALFVSYFPHLIAGPILHHREFIPQLTRPETYSPKYENLATGVTIFVFGLCKKVLLADTFAPYADRVFEAAATGGTVTFVEAWGGALAYTLQLYFDFSGYSDMAIGLSKMFGIRMPVNFYSPYKATSIIDFWRRWHITLSRFLRNYLYIPLGGRRRGEVRRLVNILVTMLLGGLWHGAGWTFVVWGGLHGIYLVVNHLWRNWKRKYIQRSLVNPKAAAVLAMTVTFLAVVVAWVVFRAPNLESAAVVLKGMAGVNGIALPPRVLDSLGIAGQWLLHSGLTAQPLPLFGGTRELALLAVFLAFVWFLPNTQQLTQAFEPALPTYDTAGQAARPRLTWQPSPAWCLAVTGGYLASLWVILSRPESPFLYFNF